MQTSEEKEGFDQILEKLDRLDNRVAKIEHYLDKQKGFVGGILFVVSGIAWLVTAAKDWFK